MFSVLVWGCNWILFIHGLFCQIGLIRRKSLHFEKKTRIPQAISCLLSTVPLQTARHRIVYTTVLVLYLSKKWHDCLNERKSLLRRSHAVLPSHISQVWGGGHQPTMGGSSAKYGGVINQLWGGASAKYGGVIDQQLGGVISQSMGGSSTNYGGGISQLWGAISQVWGGHQPTMGGGHQPSMGGGIFPPVCTGSQNRENYFSNTYVNRTAGPITHSKTSSNWYRETQCMKDM